MSKNDETPIEFEVPGPGGRGSKIPVPINQPHWVYQRPKQSSRLTSFLGLIGLSLFIFGIGMLVLTTNETSNNWGIGLFVGGFLLFTMGIGMQGLHKPKRNKINDKADEHPDSHPNKQEKSRAKKRKDER